MSYGVNAPQGLEPFGYITGGTWNGATNQYALPSGYNTNIFSGDPVYYAATGKIVRATAGDTNPILGTFRGVKYRAADGTFTFSPYWPANTITFGAQDATALVADDQNILYNIQSEGTIAAADIFQNGNIDFGVAGSTVTGQSGARIDAVTNVGATFQLKIIALTPHVSNAFGVQFNNVLVLINNNPYKGGTGTVGL